MKHCRNNNGAALVVTLGVVAVLMAAVLQLGKQVSYSVSVTAMEKDRFSARQKALSGINLASLLLVQDKEKTDVDSVQESWADAEKISQIIAILGYTADEFEIKIIDESSKICVNAVMAGFPGNTVNPSQLQVLENWVRQIDEMQEDEEALDPDEVMNCLKDWMDSGDDDAVSGLSGAESEYYLALDPPYEAANGPLNHLNEIWLVKGMNRDIFEPDPESEKDAPVPLDQMLTVHGLSETGEPDGGYVYSGRVNINTAGAEVLAALLPEGYQEAAVDLVDFRAQMNEDGTVFLNPLDKGWYSRVIELSQEDQTRFESTIKYDSDLFRVICNTRHGQVAISMEAIIKREQNEDGRWVTRIMQLETDS